MPFVRLTWRTSQITHPNSVVMPEVAASADGAGEDSSEDDGDDE